MAVPEALASIQRWWDRLTGPGALFTREQIRVLLVEEAGLRELEPEYHGSAGDKPFGFTVTENEAGFVVRWPEGTERSFIRSYLARAIVALDRAGYRGFHELAADGERLTLVIRRP